jgi:hypothetical protein
MYITVKEKEYQMKITLGWFGTLHPIVQAVVVVCSCVFLFFLVLNREASANFLNILPWFLALLGSKRNPEE